MECNNSRVRNVPRGKKVVWSTMTELPWKKYESPASWYSLKYPTTWSFAEDAECTSFYNETDGEGALQISAYETISNNDPAEALSEYLTTQEVDFLVKDLLPVSGVNMAMASYSKDDDSTDVWVVSNDRLLLFITYTRETGSSNRELVLIEKILTTLQVNS